MSKSLKARLNQIEKFMLNNIVELAAKDYEDHFINFQNSDLALQIITRDYSLGDDKLVEVKNLLISKGYKF